MRTLPLFLVLSACEGFGGFDPRSACPWSFEVLDPSTPHLALTLIEGPYCQPPEQSPSVLYIEAVVKQGEAETDPDAPLGVLCNMENHVTALLVEDLPPQSLSYRPWQPDQPGTIAEHFPEREVDGGWYKASYLIADEAGGAMGNDAWSGLFQLSDDGATVSWAECAEWQE